MPTVIRCDECKRPMLTIDNQPCWECAASLCPNCNQFEHFCAIPTEEDQPCPKATP